MNNQEELIKNIKEQYPPGTRIRLIEMQDPYSSVSPGTEGMVDIVDDIGTIHTRWDDGRRLGLVVGEDRFSVISEPIQTLKLYMPLTVKQYESDEGGSLMDHPTELDQDVILSCHDQILAAIIRKRLTEDTERGLMKYYHGDISVDKKVKSLFFTVEQVGSRLVGVAECRAQGDLSDKEVQILKDYAEGQAADGFGEEFEQHPIKIGSDEIYVSLWSASKNWSIMTQDELGDMNRQMGGMTLG